MKIAALFLSGALVLAAAIIVWLLPGFVQHVVLNGTAHGPRRQSSLRAGSEFVVARTSAGCLAVTTTRYPRPFNN